MSTFDPHHDEGKPRLPNSAKFLHYIIILCLALCLIGVLPNAVLVVIGCWQVGAWARLVYEWIISREEKRL